MGEGLKRAFAAAEATRASKRELEAAAAAYNVYFAYYGTAPAWDNLKASMQMVWVRIVRAALAQETENAAPSTSSERGSE